jgi:hypothetical protein
MWYKAESYLPEESCELNLKVGNEVCWYGKYIREDLDGYGESFYFENSSGWGSLWSENFHLVEWQWKN